MSKKNEAFGVISIPPVLSLERVFEASDGYMFENKWEDRYNDINKKPLQLSTATYRGTQSHRTASDKDIRNANIQRVDRCALTYGMDTLQVEMTLKVLNGICFSNCMDDFKKVVCDKLETVGDLYNELARRYAINIANARMLFRNRKKADVVETIVQLDGTKLRFNGKLDEKKKDFVIEDDDAILNGVPVPFKGWNTNNHDIDILTNAIAERLSGKAKSHLFLTITYNAFMGMGQEVFPSQEFIEKNTMIVPKSKALYQAKTIYGDSGLIAAMHSVKLNNGLRTIDDWYDGAGNNVIPVEVYGSVTLNNVAYRDKKSKKDFYTLFDRWMTQEAELEPEEKMFVIAVLMRGGVFGKAAEKE